MKLARDKTYYLPFIFYTIANLLHLFFTYLSLSGSGERGVLAICVFILFHIPFIYLGVIPTIVFLITIRKEWRVVLLTLGAALVYVLQIFLFYYGIS